MSPSRKTIGLLAGLGLLLAALVLTLFAGPGRHDGPATATATKAAATSAKPGTKAPEPGAPVGSPSSRAPGVPDRAYATLAEIDAGRWPDSANAPGTKGGEQWMNRDRTLPATDAAGKAVRYQEWDVNPKQRNRSRDAERIVTGSDGTAWYTADHYETFTRMR
ncbi:ribonuclease domain-containing protein [Nocardia thailandica]|uniref:Ribonuclease domain-containing protein n=1 Tax=Nocardia thailandica TaxID=257275 RepID=A0ABW6PJY4_9NOCA